MAGWIGEGMDGWINSGQIDKQSVRQNTEKPTNK